MLPSLFNDKAEECLFTCQPLVHILYWNVSIPGVSVTNKWVWILIGIFGHFGIIYALHVSFQNLVLTLLKARNLITSFLGFKIAWLTMYGMGDRSVVFLIVKKNINCMPLIRKVKLRKFQKQMVKLRRGSCMILLPIPNYFSCFFVFFPYRKLKWQNFERFIFYFISF